MKPALEPALETHLLRAALHSVFTLGTEKDTTGIQTLHKVIPEVLDAMLGNLLAESPDTDRLHFILEHVNLWVVSRVSQERARAIRSSTALLRYTVTLPEFDVSELRAQLAGSRRRRAGSSGLQDLLLLPGLWLRRISAEFPRMGHHVAQLALFVSDPDKDVSRQAREGTYRLYQLLLQQRGLTIHEVEDLWCYDWHQDSRLLGYKNTARVGEVFGKFFSVGQRRSFVQTALLAIHDPLLRVSQAGLVLVYSLLGEAQQLMGDTHEDVTAKVMCQLHIIRHLHQMPEALQGLWLI
nr:maestro heat-like repeat-containing protein family member 1 [Caretta caretta]